MEKKILKTVNAILSLNKITSFITYILLTFSVLGVIWTLFDAAGIQGNIKTLILLLIISLLLSSSFWFLRFFRWNLIDWTLKKNFEPIIQYDPSVIIGIGRGGAIVGALILKIIADRNKKEPGFCVIDRTYIEEEDFINVDIAKATKLNIEYLQKQSNVLVVTAEVHTGNTLKKVREFLNAQKIKHKVFSYVISRMAGARVDFHILKSDSREILPWSMSPYHDAKSQD